MEPLDEKELNALLRRWKAPDTPAGLGRRVLGHRGSWWRWLWSGTIRVPVPVLGAAFVVLLAVWIYSSASSPSSDVGPAPPASGRPDPVSLADFQPVRQLEPRIVGEKQ